MITFIYILLALLTLAADYRAYRLSGSRPFIAVVLLLLCALPLLPMAVKLFVRDNTEAVVRLEMWTQTIYIIVTLTRLALYAGWMICQSRVVGVLLATATAAILINGLVNTRTALTIKSVTITDNSLPQSFDGYRILLFSDLHIGSMLNPEQELAAVVEAVERQRVDMVLFGGDLIHIRHNELNKSVISQLRQITAPDGVYAVLGNHDTGASIKDSLTTPRATNIAHLCSSIGQMGWRVLRDSTIYVTRGCDSIAVTGLDYTEEMLEYKHSLFSRAEFSPVEPFATVPDSLYNIALVHLPQLWQGIVESGCAELTLSGHTHASQIAVELFGYRLSPAMVMYRQWSGLYEKSRKRLYITDGIGCVGFYMRLGAKPELTVIELRR